jgi:homoserine dehydrogenase
MEGMSYQQALSIAQERGFAEADPAMDVSGADAAQKLAILASILFNQPIDYNLIPRKGIEGLLPVDARTFKSWGLMIKPLVMARVRDVADDLLLYVTPALVSLDHPLAAVSEENNALSLYLKGRKEPITKIGKGAGAIPTARSIVRDILDVSRKARAYMVDVPKFFKSKVRRNLAPALGIEKPWYVRFSVLDSPGVLGKITTMLGDFELSILRVLQEAGAGGSEPAHILLELRSAPAERLERAVDLISRLPFARGHFFCIKL